MPPPQANNIHYLRADSSSGDPTEDQQNVHYLGVMVWLNVQSLGGTSPEITATIQRKDPESGTYENVLTTGTITATGLATLQVHPALTEAANAKASELLGRHWRVNIELKTSAGNETYTYDLAYTQIGRC